MSLQSARDVVKSFLLLPDRSGPFTCREKCLLTFQRWPFSACCGIGDLISLIRRTCEMLRATNKQGRPNEQEMARWASSGIPRRCVSGSTSTFIPAGTATHQEAVPLEGADDVGDL